MIAGHLNMAAFKTYQKLIMTKKLVGDKILNIQTGSFFIDNND